jgi:hypothetical protein
MLAKLRHGHERASSPMNQSVLLVAHRTVVSPTLRDFLNRRRGEMTFTLVVPNAASALSNPEITATIDELRGSGLIADVRFGDRDPLLAVADHWDPRRFDAIVISTFAPASSRWLASALPRRIEKLTGALVTEIHSTNRMPPPAMRRPEERYA